jgi:bacterial/archaeal transporter family-2 protein
MVRYLFILMAFIAGAILPIQAALNGKMGKVVHHPVVATFISFLVGTLALGLYLLLSKQPFSLGLTFKQAPWYAWLGGVIGTFYVAGSIMLLPRLGVALTFGIVISGQLFISVLIDHYGWFGVAVRPINWYRLLGVLLLFMGVLLIRNSK